MKISPIVFIPVLVIALAVAGAFASVYFGA